MEGKLLSSLSLFSELTNAKKDIRDLIGYLITEAALAEQRYLFTTYELKNMLEHHFGFNLPEGVIRTVMKRLKLQGHIENDNKGNYVFKNSVQDPDLQKKLKENTINYNNIIINLKEFIKETDPEISIIDLELSFSEFLLNNKHDKFATIFSTYILTQSQNERFIETLNELREGIIIYNGIAYSGDLNFDAKPSPLVIYLDTEYLFNFNGFNGSFPQIAINELIDLCQEINRKHPNTITFRYFENTKYEVQSLIYAVKMLVDNRQLIDPGKEAMKYIANRYKTESDIDRLESSFFMNLKIHNIQQDETSWNFNLLKDYNLEDEKVAAKFLEEYDQENYPVTTDKILQILKQFTFINYLRKGKNQVRLENSGYVILSGKRISNLLAWSPTIKEKEFDATYSTTLEYLISKFWFSHNIGLASKRKMPMQFNVIAKAQYTLSGKLNNSISKSFEDLKDEVSKGLLNEDQAKAWLGRLMKKESTPDRLNEKNALESYEFLLDNKPLQYYNDLEDQKVRNNKLIIDLQDKNKKEAELTNKFNELRREQLLEARSSFLKGSFYTKMKIKYLLTHSNSILAVFIVLTFVLALLAFREGQSIVGYISLGISLSPAIALIKNNRRRAYDARIKKELFKKIFRVYSKNLREINFKYR
jgi:hypothetical protein